MPIRRFSSVAAKSVSVIGAGPAGIACVAKIYDSTNYLINWIDPHFQGGKLAAYHQVPSNTKVEVFLKFAHVSPCLDKLARSDKFDMNVFDKHPVREIEKLHQDVGCDLSHAQKLCLHLSTGLDGGRIHKHKGFVTEINYSTCEKKYELTLAKGTAPIKSDNLIICHGSEPIIAPAKPPHSKFPHIKTLHLLDCLDPSKLSKTITSTDTVIIVGSSHSAILCLKNLSDLNPRPKIINLYRNPLIYAEHKDGWILYDNTGLKQMAATWAKQNLEKDEDALRVGIERIKLVDEESVYSKILPTATHITYAIGFKPLPLPKIRIDNHQVQYTGYNKKNGVLEFDNTPLESSRGYGIAFPEETVDPVGNVELAVGMWKFQKYIREKLEI